MKVGCWSSGGATQRHIKSVWMWKKRREKIQCHECFLNRKISYLLRRGAMRTYLWTVLGVSLTWKFPIWRHRMARGHTLVMREGIPNVIRYGTASTHIFLFFWTCTWRSCCCSCWRHAWNPLFDLFTGKLIDLFFFFVEFCFMIEFLFIFCAPQLGRVIMRFFFLCWRALFTIRHVIAVLSASYYLWSLLAQI